MFATELEVTDHQWVISMPKFNPTVSKHAQFLEFVRVILARAQVLSGGGAIGKALIGAS